MNWLGFQMNSKKYLLGIDIGKTKISCGVFENSLELVEYIVFPSSNMAQKILNNVNEIIEKCFEKYKLNIIGIAIASFGIIDIEKGTVLSSGIVKDWNNIPLKDYFESCFHVPVYVENDVKAALYGEYFYLNKKNCSILYFSIGTNIGMAYIKDGMLWRGDRGRFGEISSYVPQNQIYSLGELVGGQGISQQYYHRMGKWKTGEEIFSMAMCKDVVAEEVYERMINSTAEIMHWFDMCFDSTYLILGGGMVCQNNLLFKKIRQQYEAISDNNRNDLYLANLKEKSGIYGAVVRLWYNMYGFLPTLDNV